MLILVEFNDTLTPFIQLPITPDIIITPDPNMQLIKPNLLLNHKVLIISHWLLITSNIQFLTYDIIHYHIIKITE